MAHEALITADVLPPGRRIILTDIDGTLTQGLTISSFAEFLHNNDSFDSPSWHKMQEDFSHYGDSDHGHASYERFALDLVVHYSEGLRGQKVNDILGMADEFFILVQGNQVPDYKIFPFSEQLIEIMNKVGAVVAVSGSPSESLFPLKRILDFGDLQATTVRQENGTYTGAVDLNLALDLEKEKVVKRHITGETDIARSFAFGDTMHDLPLLEAVGNPFVVGDNSHLLAVARRRGWSIISPDNAIDQVVERIDRIFKK